MDSHGFSLDAIQTREDLKKIPILTKSIIKNNFNDIIADNYQKKRLVEVTSGGSTGNQSVILKSSYYEHMSRAATLRNNLLANWLPSDRVVWIWGSPYEHLAVKLSIIARLGILVNRRLLFNAYLYSQSDFPGLVKQINSFKPAVIYGYASIILEFSKYILLNMIELPPVKSIITTSETLEQKELISKAFKSKVYNQYGCREIPALAIDAEPGIMHISDDNVALNIYENNHIIITALHSFGFPLINYQLGDRGVNLDKEIMDTALPFTAMRLSIGRITDNFLNSSGKTISSSSLGTYISTLKPPIVEHQIIQCEYNKFVVNCIPDKSFKIYEYSCNLHKVLSEYFGNNIEVHVNIVDNIGVEKSGKGLMFKRIFNIDN